jgi:ElaA protein
MPAGAFACQVLTLAEMTAAQMLDVLELRSKVFVVEQNCVYQDPGDEDRHPETRHVLLLDAQGNTVAYVRLLAPGVDGPDPVIGRVVSPATPPGRGRPQELMRQALAQVDRLWPKRDIRLHAQTYLERFYQGHGFEPRGEVYLLDGIDHIEMVRAVG